MITTAFWILLAVDTLALVTLFVIAAQGPRNPEGLVGAWLVLLPIFMIAGCALLGFVTKSNGVKIAGICVLTFPWVIAILGPGYNSWRRYSFDRIHRGDSDFRGPQRELAHAILARDAALVRSLIPKAGDLNQQYGSQTLLEFAVQNAADFSLPRQAVPPASMEIIQALLNAGADPDRPPVRDRPLTLALRSAPQLAEMLLKAGAKPNHIGDMDRPIWWQVLSGDPDKKIQTLELLLDHGADVSLSNKAQGGPVAYAATGSRGTNWRAVWLLVERGAPWQNEQSFGTTVQSMLATDIAEREANHQPISDEMRMLQLKYDGAR